MLIAVTLLLIVSLIIVVYNYNTAPVFRPIEGKTDNRPFVSVLIPARNEEVNIERCLNGLSKQDYNPFEVIVGNDHSKDKTAEIVSEYSRRFPFIKIIELPELPEGWKGKNYGAHILSQQASGEIFLFLDADVVVNTGAVSSAVKYLISYKADILSVFPGQLIISWGEKLIVPLLHLFLLSLLPLKQVYKSRRPSLSAGIGQFIMFRKDAYQQLGGHSRLKDEIAEDLEFVRIAKREGLKVLTMLDGGLTACRMYHSLRDAINGFTKNFFKGSRFPAPIFVFFLTIYFLVFFAPFLLIFNNIFYAVPILIILNIRWMISKLSEQSIINIVLHPLQMIFFYLIGIRSLVFWDKVKWKGRTV